jgi:hypothetical protein
MDTAAVPKRRTTLWIGLTLLLVLCLGAAAGLWYVRAQVGTRPDGTRVTLVPPGGVNSMSSTGPLPIILGADIAADGLKVVPGEFHAESEQSLFLLRQKVTLQVAITAGNQPVDTARLGYVLQDAAGAVVSEGAFRPETRIAAGQTKTVQIVDAGLADAKRIEIRKLP